MDIANRPLPSEEAIDGELGDKIVTVLAGKPKQLENPCSSEIVFSV